MAPASRPTTVAGGAGEGATGTPGADRRGPEADRGRTRRRPPARSAAAHPDRPALRLGADELTFAELDDLSSRAAARLRALGTASGDRVAVLLPNSPVFAVLYYGILRAGAIVVPLNPALRAGEVEHCLDDAGAALLLAWHRDAQEAVEGARRTGTPHLVVEPRAFLDGLRAHRPPDRDEPRSPADSAVVLYTSGTTGDPKGAELTHRNLRRNVDEGARVLRLGPTDVVFGGLPLFHSFGQVMGLNCAVSVGACLTLLPRFTPEDALSVIERDRVTVFLGVPTMYTLMLRLAQDPGSRPRDPSTLRVGLCGGSPMPVEVLHGFEEAFACAVLEGYGLSEASPLACVNRIDRERVAGTVGVPVDGVEMRVVDRAGRELPDGEVGEIVIRGHNVMRGYWRRPRATAEAVRDGWLHTGDLGVRDARGDFRIVDRIKDLVIRGGCNVHPREVEEVLHAHPAVAEAAVVGVPHEVHGQEVAAAVVLRAGRSATPEELIGFVRERVAPFKYPRVVWITDHLPKGPTGKVLKREIVRPGPDAGRGSTG
ncbi:long-chain fatty acid--CoA ligase [Streptomyces somaliensis DSM 40738]|uniref:Long-chain fatty acid--CoA ligase n=1 Tax=Streptomyces somaliensis (strain ATCC 33201 / DSM 40738 / JCM 12659 / KCTC 9044 / NCTC 11332 / NRRL B-12077 / IP 733) TaxID=1134445 RepID=A0AA44DG68_STRE0|nr:long-chain fatty acid--CoA ligase [Streptomyces somaliensis DSM 40738]